MEGRHTKCPNSVWCQTCPLARSALPKTAVRASVAGASIAAGEHNRAVPALGWGAGNFCWWVLRNCTLELLRPATPLLHSPSAPKKRTCFKRKCGKPVRGARFVDKPALRVKGATTYAACCKLCRTMSGCLRFTLSARGCALYRTKPRLKAVRAPGHIVGYRKLCAAGCALPVLQPATGAYAAKPSAEAACLLLPQMCWPSSARWQCRPARSARSWRRCARHVAAATRRRDRGASRGGGGGGGADEGCARHFS